MHKVEFHSGHGFQDLRPPIHPETTALHKEWEDIIPLNPHMRLLDMSIDSIPKALRPWIECETKRLGCPVIALAAVAIASAAGIAGSRVCCTPKQHDSGWKVSLAQLWVVLVGSPGTKKTPILAKGLRPLDALENLSRKAYEEFETQHRSHREKLELKLHALKKQASNSKPFGEDTQSDLAREIDVTEEEIKKLKRVQHRRKFNDATVEKVAMLLAENPNGLVLTVDELTSWIKGLEKPGQEGSRGFFLSAHNGLQSYTVDRVGRGTLYVPKHFTIVIGGIQPGPFRTLLADQRKTESDGLIQRFQLLVNLNQQDFAPEMDVPPDQRAWEKVQKVFHALDELKFLPTRNSDEQVSLRFSESAQRQFIEWFKLHNEELRTVKMEPAMESFVSKSASTVVALALIFQLIDLSDSYTQDSELNSDWPSQFTEVDLVISEDAFLQAKDWVRIFRTHAEYAFTAANNPAMIGAQRLLDAIGKGLIDDGCTFREIYRHQWTHLRSNEEVKDAVQILEAHHYVQHSTLKVTKPSSIILFNPAVKRTMLA
ncbi:MAG: YfjI family protein [Pseudobdellovibrionaceae bacterium]|nr:YfjI family protein [Pseudobdellovibrionaceae bacterium]